MRLCLSGVLLSLVFGVGCRSAADHRAEADETAGRIIEAAQRTALGEASDFTIGRAEQTLRERLLIDQDLPLSAPGSVGTGYIERVEHWPDMGYLDAGWVLVGCRAGRTRSGMARSGFR